MPPKPPQPPTLPPTATPAPSYAHTLVSRAYPPAAAATLHRDRILRRALHLHPSTANDQPASARATRQRVRDAKAAEKRRRKRPPPRPLSARERRVLGLHEVPREMVRWEVWEGVHRMWLGYVREILGIRSGGGGGGGAEVVVDGRGAGPLLAAADLHGALVEVVRCRCVGRVGLKGIVAKETRGTVEVVTRGNQLKG
jgi:ribonuclease P protein subunit POP4